jgi:hypothetical protein
MYLMVFALGGQQADERVQASGSSDGATSRPGASQASRGLGDCLGWWRTTRRREPRGRGEFSVSVIDPLYAAERAEDLVADVDALPALLRLRKVVPALVEGTTDTDVLRVPSDTPTEPAGFAPPRAGRHERHIQRHVVRFDLVEELVDLGGVEDLDLALILGSKRPV